MTCLVLCFAVSAHALLYEFNAVISGETPGGQKPWLTAEFTNTTRKINNDDKSGVLLKLRAPHLVSNTEFVTKWFFNNTLENAIEGLMFSYQFEGTALAKKNFYPVDVDDLHAGAGALFDVYFQFQANNNKRFENGDSADIFMYGVQGLTAETFNAVSTHTTNSPNKQYFAEAHIQGISTGTGSAWVVPITTPAPVPEPGTMILLGFGMLGLSVYGKRRMNKH